MRGTPLYMRLADSLLGDISSGRLKQGDRLPAEEQLSHMHGVSRITVRQALDVLRQRHLIERFAGRGSFVTQPPDIGAWTINSVEDVVRLGAETETDVLHWGRVPPPPQVRQLLGVSTETVYQLQGIRRRHGEPVYYIELYTLYDLGRRLKRHDLRQRTVVELIEEKLGVPVASGIEELSAGVANRRLARLLQVRVGSPLLTQDLRFFGLDGRPIECLRGWYRPDRFTRMNRLSRRG